MKAKDLRGKNIEDIEDVNKSDSGDEDAVSAAYENISKKLESIRGGNEVEEEIEVTEDTKGSKDSEEEEIELKEWKGPRKPTKEDFVEVEEEEDTHELRKVKLHNLEEPKDEKEEEDEDEIDPLDEDTEGTEVSKVIEDLDEESHLAKASRDKWEPEKNDPLDDEDDEVSKGSDVPKVSKAEELDDEAHFAKASRDEDETAFESDNLELPGKDRRESEVSDMPEDVDRFESEVKSDDDEAHSAGASRDESPDSLDDLAEEKPQRTLSDMAEDDYFIPKLKASGQREGDLGYNAHPQRSGLGESYSPKHNNMEANDPNSYFSQHQPQAPKRANKFHLLILVVIGVAVIGFTVYILKGGFGELNIGSTASPSPSPSVEAPPIPTPPPTPEPEIEKGDFSVRVLNGTSTSGLAKTISDKLKGEGYKTSGTGNAPDGDDVAQTQIRVKEGTESAMLFESLKADLAPDYEATQGDDLAKSATYDAEVVIGAK